MRRTVIAGGLLGLAYLGGCQETSEPTLHAQPTSPAEADVTELREEIQTPQSVVIKLSQTIAEPQPIEYTVPTESAFPYLFMFTGSPELDYNEEGLEHGWVRSRVAVLKYGEKNIVAIENGYYSPTRFGKMTAMQIHFEKMRDNPEDHDAIYKEWKEFEDNLFLTKHRTSIRGYLTRDEDGNSFLEYINEADRPNIKAFLEENGFRGEMSFWNKSKF